MEGWQEHIRTGRPDCHLWQCIDCKNLLNRPPETDLGGLGRCSVTIATQEGQSAACASLTGRLTKERTEGQTAGEKGEWRWLYFCVVRFCACVCVCKQETHHLQSPWRWCGGCSPGKRLAPRPPGAAPCEARSAPTAPSHRGALSGYLWWVGCRGLKGQTPGLLWAIVAKWKSTCKQI